MLPARKIHKAVSAFQDWFQKPDRELQDELSQAFAKQPDEKQPKPALAAQGDQAVLNDVVQKLNHAAEGVPTSVRVTMRTPGGAAPEKEKRPVVGLKTREAGDRPRANDKGLVQNRQDDTVYRERNEKVSQVHQRYVKYGERVAAAMLGKTFSPNGLRNVMEKLGLKLSGSELGDHARIIDYIEQNGVDKFCGLMGIRTENSMISEDDLKRPTASAPSADGPEAVVRPYHTPFQDGKSKQLAGPRKGLSVKEVVRRPQQASDPVPSEVMVSHLERKPAAGASAHPKPASEDAKRKPLLIEPRSLNGSGTPKPVADNQKQTPARKNDASKSSKPAIRDVNRLSPADLCPKPLAARKPDEPQMPAKPEIRDAMTPQPIAKPAEPGKQGKLTSNSPINQYLKAEFDTTFDL